MKFVYPRGPCIEPDPGGSDLLSGLAGSTQAGLETDTYCCREVRRSMRSSRGSPKRNRMSTTVARPSCSRRRSVAAPARQARVRGDRLERDARGVPRRVVGHLRRDPPTSDPPRRTRSSGATSSTTAVGRWGAYACGGRSPAKTPQPPNAGLPQLPPARSHCKSREPTPGLEPGTPSLRGLISCRRRTLRVARSRMVPRNLVDRGGGRRPQTAKA
jgi:hypothetical protein